jgi:hypothetical protein
VLTHEAAPFWPVQRRVFALRAALPDAKPPAIVRADVKGRLRLFALDAGLRAMAAKEVSGRGSHVPVSFDPMALLGPRSNMEAWAQLGDHPSLA